MKLARDIAAHSILAVGGLTLAYLVWTDHGPDVNENEVTIAECDPDDVSRVELRSEERDVTIELRDDHGERLAWLTVVRRPENGEATTERFVGSKAVGEWLEQVAPLRARRSLGELSGEQLEDVGLDHPDGRLTLRCGGTQTVLQLGGRAYGNGDRYVRAERGGPVYLVASDRLTPLESAEFRLMERELHTFEPREVVSLTLRAFGQEKQLLQRNRMDERGAEWVDASDPERRNETYGNWLSRFPRLRVQRYLDPEARPGADLEGMSAAAQPVVRLTYQGERRELGFLEMQRVDGAEQAYYARSETTRSWVRVPTSVAQQIEDDLRSMLGLEPLPRPSAAPSPGTEQAPTEGAAESPTTQGAADPSTPSGPDGAHPTAPSPTAASGPDGAHPTAPSPAAPPGGAAAPPTPRSAPPSGASEGTASPAH